MAQSPHALPVSPSYMQHHLCRFNFLEHPKHTVLLGIGCIRHVSKHTAPQAFVIMRMRDMSSTATNICNHPLDAWKNMPMIAIIARRPFASSADNFFVFSAGSLDVSTLKP